jgi:hypothetical protein
MREPLPVANPLASVPAPEPADAADVEALRLALVELPRQQRRAFLLREFSGLSYAELGIALGLSQPAVESLLFRARRGLRGALRTAAAAAVSFPATIRDSLAQLLSGDPAGPATIAKLASLPLTAKLASLTAGTALVVAGAVEVAPARHHRAARATAPRPAARTVDSVQPSRAAAVARRPSVSFVAAHRPVTQAVVGKKRRDEAEQRSRRDDAPDAAERPQAEDRGEAQTATPTPAQQASGDDADAAAAGVRRGEGSSGPAGDDSGSGRAMDSGESGDSGGSSGPGS